MFCFCTFPISNFNISIFILVLFTLRYKIVFCYSFVKGPLSLVSAICSQRTSVLVYLFYIQRLLSLLLVLFTKDYVLVSCYSFAKDCCPCLWLFIFKGPLSLSFCYSFAKDCCPCLVLFTCKGLLSLSSAIHLQRTLCYSFAKDCSPCLVPLVCEETAVLIFRFCPKQIKMDCSLTKHGELLSSQGS